MAAIRFDQDPDAPPGAGMFELDDGRSFYAHDPDLAKSLTGPDLSGPEAYRIDPELIAAATQPQDYEAKNRFQTTDQRLAGGGPAPGLDDQLGKMNFQSPPAPSQPPPEAQQPPPQATGGGPQQAPPQEQPTEFDQNVSNYVQNEARKRSARTPEAWIPKTRAETVETEGVPYNAEDAAVRIKANQDLMAAKGATAEMMHARAVNNLAAEKAAQPALLQKAAEAQKQLDAQHSAYMQDRADLQNAMDAKVQSQGEWFASKSTLAKLVMVLGQAFGAYAGIKSRTGKNYAQEAIQGMMESDIATQREQAKRGVDNAYRRLELRYKDKDQAEAALRIAQGNVLSNVQSMQASANQAQDVQAAHQEMLAQNQANMVAQEQKFQNAAFGKHTVKQDVTYRQASGGGAADPVAIAKKLKAMGLTDEQVRTAMFGSGGAPDKDIREEARDLSDKAAPIVKALSELAPAREMIQRYQGADSIPGTGYTADVLNKIPFGKRIAMSDEERENFGIKERLKLSIRHAVTGAGGNIKELEGIDAAIDGAKTPQELSAVVSQADRALKDQLTSMSAGRDPRAVKLWQSRGGYQPKEAPKSLKREDM